MIASNSQMITGHDLDSGSFITYFSKKRGKGFHDLHVTFEC